MVTRQRRPRAPAHGAAPTHDARVRATRTPTHPSRPPQASHPTTGSRTHPSEGEHHMKTSRPNDEAPGAAR